MLRNTKTTKRMETMKIYWIYDENRKRITKTPIAEQAAGYARRAAKRTGKLFACDNDFGNKSWYGPNGFICNNH